MDEKKFWSLIEQSRQKAKHNPELQMTQLEELLSPLSETEFLTFYDIFDSLYAKSYEGNLWGAAYIISGGCSDDGFDYFRAWLIAQGKDTFYNALENPDSLVKVANHEDVYPELEEILGLLYTMAVEKTGLEDFSEKVTSHPYPEISFDNWYDDKTDDLDEKKAKKLFPQLYKAFW
jgi:hypothetical protein